MIGRSIRYCAYPVVFFCIIIAVVETGLRLWTRVSPIYDLEMLRYAKELKQRGGIPGLTHEHIPNSFAHLMGVDFKINSIGFRDDELQMIPGKRNYSILVLGCSNTVGWGVDHNRVFTALLEDELNSNVRDTVFHVINAGVGNYNTYLESLQLNQKWEVTKPDMVVLHYYINDAEIVKRGKSNTLAAYSYSYTLLRNKLRYTELLDSFSDVGSYYRSLYSEDNRGWTLARNSILAIRDLCVSKNVAFTVLIQPDLHDLGMDSEQAGCHKIISTFLRESEISYLDLMPCYRSHNDAGEKTFWVSAEDAHPNVLGHRVIFEAALPFLRESMVMKAFPDAD